VISVLPCAETEIVRDDEIFDAVLVACGRFGVIYSFVLEVRPSFRVVEAVTTPTRAAVLAALRDGVDDGTLFQPLFDLLGETALPAGIPDATGTPYFFQVLFSSQNPNDVWVHRRWETDLTDESTHVEATSTDNDVATAIVIATNAALAAGIVAAGPGGPYILAVQIAFNAEIASRPFTLGSVVAAALNVLWRVPLASHVIPGLNYSVIDARFRRAIEEGRRGPFNLITSGTRADSDNISYRADSIELVFDATKRDYLDFLDEILTMAQTFQQAGYISLRPSRASKALLSMHRVEGSHAMSIEISTLKNLPGNAQWMGYVHQRAVARGGRPHWGQYNKLDVRDVAMLYGKALDDWRESLMRVSGTSTGFSNIFSRARGLEPRGIVREVTAVRRLQISDSKLGPITHLCNSQARWSPVPKRQAVQEIESGTVHYFVRTVSGLTPLRAIGGRYVRLSADDASGNNLYSLPLC
jgi:hypothetical protein